MIRIVTATGLAIVAGCAVAVSFAGLYSLAVLCSFAPELATLVPVLVDAGAGVATVVWLAGDVPSKARRYARRLALGLLASSVAGNAASHALAAAGARPHWLVVVAVGALAPAVLAAVIHLAALVKAGREEDMADGDRHDRQEVSTQQEVSPGDVEVWDGNDLGPGLDMTGWPAASPLVTTVEPVEVEVGGEVAPYGFTGTTETKEGWHAYAAHLIGRGFGRKRLARELDLTEHEARALLAKHRGRQESPGEDVA